MNPPDITRYIAEINSFLKVQCYPAAEARIQLLENSELDEASISYLRNVHKITASCCKFCVEAHKKLLCSGFKYNSDFRTGAAEIGRATYLPSILQYQSGTGRIPLQNYNIGAKDLEISVTKLAGDNEALRAYLGYAYLAEKKANFSAIYLRNKFAELVVKNYSMSQYIEQFKTYLIARPVPQYYDENVYTNQLEDILMGMRHYSIQTDLQTTAQAIQTDCAMTANSIIEQAFLKLKQEMDLVKDNLLYVRRIRFVTPEELNTALESLTGLARLSRLSLDYKAGNYTKEQGADGETQTEADQGDEYDIECYVLREYLASVPIILKYLKLNMQQIKGDMLYFSTQFEQLANEASNGAQQQLVLWKQSNVYPTDCGASKSAENEYTQQYSVAGIYTDASAIDHAGVLLKMRELKGAVDALKRYVFEECRYDKSILLSMDALEKRLSMYTSTVICRQLDYYESVSVTDGTVYTELSFSQLCTEAYAKEKYSTSLHVAASQTECLEADEMVRPQIEGNDAYLPNSQQTNEKTAEAAILEELQRELAELKQKRADYKGVLDSIAYYVDFTARYRDVLSIALVRAENIERSVQLTEKTLNEALKAERRKCNDEALLLRDYLKAYMTKCESLAAEYQQTRAYLLTSQQELLATQEELAAKQQLVFDQQQQAEAQSMSLADLQTELYKNRDYVLAGAEYVYQLELDIGVLKQTIQDLKQEISVTYYQIQYQEEENRKLGYECADSRKEIAELHEKNAELECLKLQAADTSPEGFLALYQLVERYKEHIYRYHTQIAEYQGNQREARRISLALEAKEAEISTLQAYLSGARIELDAERRRAAEELDSAFGEQQCAIRLTEEIRQLERLRLELMEQIKALHLRAREAP